MYEVTWEVTEADGKPSVQSTATKHVLVKAIDIPSDMPEGQKTFAQTYNSMRETLMNNGLMNKK